MGRDYDFYCFSGKEIFKYAVIYLGVCLGVSWLFYHSLWMALVLLPGGIFFLRDRRKKKIQTEKDKLLVQFLTGIQAVSNALNAGYSMDNAVGEALKETEKVYGAEGVFVTELRDMDRKLHLNQNLESLWEDLGKRSHIEDMESFGEIFAVARRCGGDVNEIIHNTAANIARKAEAQREIEVSLAAKRLEQKVMSLIPLAILFFVDLTAPEFLQELYHNGLGVSIMSACLVVYAVAFVWGRRIVQIEV